MTNKIKLKAQESSIDKMRKLQFSNVFYDQKKTKYEMENMIEIWVNNEDDAEIIDAIVQEELENLDMIEI